MIKVAVAGGFDPLHSGHVEHILKAGKLGDWLVVILTRDAQLVMKKGYCHQPLNRRIEIIRSELIGIVNEIVVNKDVGTIECAETLRLVKPNIFAKGGDWTEQNLPKAEVKACRDIGCRIIFGVGNKVDADGKKLSSQSIVSAVLNSIYNE